MPPLQHTSTTVMQDTHTQAQPALIPFHQHSKRVFMGVLPMVLYQSGFVLYQWAVEVLSTQSH